MSYKNKNLVEPKEHKNGYTGEKDSRVKFESAMNKDIYADFSDSVEPDPNLWKNTNLKKIVKTMGLFESLNEFQKFYVSMSLGMYLDFTMHNGGGSIVDIKYEGMSKKFTIRTVDTFHHEYSKDENYGTLMRQREVDLSTLLTEYGIPKSALSDESSFKKAMDKIKIEPRGKDVAYKLVFMAVASESGIGDVNSNSEGIYLTNKDGNELVSVSIEEIKMDKRTSEISEAARAILEWGLAAQNALIDITEPDSEISSKTRNALLKVLGTDGMLNPINFFFDGISSRISKNYSKFEPTGDSEFKSLAKDFLEKASSLEKIAKSAMDLLPDGAYKAFDMGSILISEKRYISESPDKTNIKTILNSLINVLEAKEQIVNGLLDNEPKSTDFDFLRK